jgi:hypothetical protein
VKKAVAQLEAERHKARPYLTELDLTEFACDPLHSVGDAADARRSGLHRSDLRERATTMMELEGGPRVICFLPRGRHIMGFGRGALLWLLGIPLPIILLLALFWHH